LDIEPGHRGAKMNMRILVALSEDEHHPDDANTMRSASVRSARADHAFARQLATFPRRWICTSKAQWDQDISAEILAILSANAMHRVGYTEIAAADGRKLEFWRRDALMALAESALLESLDDTVGLNRWKLFYGT